jgi:hypothetical protein
VQRATAMEDRAPRIERAAPVREAEDPFAPQAPGPATTTERPDLCAPARDRGRPMPIRLAAVRRQPRPARASHTGRSVWPPAENRRMHAAGSVRRRLRQNDLAFGSWRSAWRTTATSPAHRRRVRARCAHPPRFSGTRATPAEATADPFGSCRR